ncbi:hypothetical protein B0H63DRAFT_453644 [Podospora didyma]|uniref:Uncharacterized protein n=1 Tax=Podospora didyma TaxID=330526 RepID=A0AAE0N6U6_9PEZI|nr:hypothetical protein B0H63DRAFT_453644 [Podospora didyma]
MPDFWMMMILILLLTIHYFSTHQNPRAVDDFNPPIAHVVPAISDMLSPAPTWYRENIPPPTDRDYDEPLEFDDSDTEDYQSEEENCTIADMLARLKEQLRETGEILDSYQRENLESKELNTEAGCSSYFHQHYDDHNLSIIIETAEDD